MSSPPATARREHPVGGAQQRGQAEVDEIDAGHAERHVARRHHAFVEDVIEQIDHARIRSVEHLIRD